MENETLRVTIPAMVGDHQQVEIPLRGVGRSQLLPASAFQSCSAVKRHAENSSPAHLNHQ